MRPILIALALQACALFGGVPHVATAEEAWRDRLLAAGENRGFTCRARGPTIIMQTAGGDTMLFVFDGKGYAITIQPVHEGKEDAEVAVRAEALQELADQMLAESDESEPADTPVPIAKPRSEPASEPLQPEMRFD